MLQGLDPKLNVAIQRFLLQSGYGERQKVEPLFVDKRIHLWRSDLPPDRSNTQFVRQLVSFLYQQSDEKGNNGLMLFVAVIRNHIHKEDRNHKVCGYILQLLHKYLTEPAPTPEAKTPSGFHKTPSWLEKGFYIERREDQIALEQLKYEECTITVIGPRSMGKTSLLMQIAKQAMRLNRQVVTLDLREFDHTALQDADLFHQQFCYLLSEELGLEDQVGQYLRKPLGNSQGCSRYLSRYVLKQLNDPLLLVMDNVDALFQAEFCSDFFGMLRSWHDSRGKPNQPIWKRLSLALATSTEPYQFIPNLNQSPFSVGTIIELSDFTPEQAQALNEAYGYPLSAGEMVQLMRLLAGHPYLTRKALEWVHKEQGTAERLFEQATADRGAFGRYLGRMSRRLLGEPDQQQSLLQVIQHHRLTDEGLFLRLRSAGLIKREKGRTIVPRCQLYADYFKERLL